MPLQRLPRKPRLSQRRDMPDIFDKLISLPASELKRIRTLRGKSRGTYNRVPRRSYSRDELVIFIRENAFRSRSQLLNGRSQKDPAPYDYRKEFGSWSEAMSVIWREERAPVDRRYIVQSVVEFGLWSVRVYEDARKKRPDVFPSVRIIRREFGSWGAFKEVAIASSLRETLRAYVGLKQKLGRRPTNEDCRKARVDLSRALELLGSKAEIDRFISSMEGVI